MDSGALQPRKWQMTGIDCSTVAQASGCPEPALTDYWAHSMQPAGILRPNQPRPVIHVPNYMDHYSYRPVRDGWLSWHVG